MAAHRRPDEYEVPVGSLAMFQRYILRRCILFIGFMLMSILLKKAFCSWLCPVGTFSEFLWRSGGASSAATCACPRWFDIPLRCAEVRAARTLRCESSASCPQRRLRASWQTPYGLLADVKMLNFFRDMGITAAVVIALLVSSLDARAELLVPLSVPLRRADGAGFIAEPGKDPARSGGMHRLRRNARRHALRGSQWTSLCRFARWSARLAWSVSAVCPAQDALQLALPPRKGATAAVRWQSVAYDASRSLRSARLHLLRCGAASPARPTTGRPTCRERSTCTWCRAPIS